jgi:Holliday junction resolvasome RuvABC endonuclease subunit
MRILSIDHATRSGWSLIVDGIVTETGAITIESKDNKFLEYFNKLKKLILLKEPNIIVIEEPKHIRNIKILRFLVGLYTIIQVVGAINLVQVIEVNPKAVKKFITGNGSADKSVVMNKLIEDFNVQKELIYKPVFYKNKPGIKEFLFDESDATANGLYVFNNITTKELTK